jgi:hypothetical protein
MSGDFCYEKTPHFAKIICFTALPSTEGLLGFYGLNLVSWGKLGQVQRARSFVAPENPAVVK